MQMLTLAEQRDIRESSPRTEQGKWGEYRRTIRPGTQEGREDWRTISWAACVYKTELCRRRVYIRSRPEAEVRFLNVSSHWSKWLLNAVLKNTRECKCPVWKQSDISRKIGSDCDPTVSSPFPPAPWMPSIKMLIFVPQTFSFTYHPLNVACKYYFSSAAIFGILLNFMLQVTVCPSPRGGFNLKEIEETERNLEGL